MVASLDKLTAGRSAGRAQGGTLSPDDTMVGSPKLTQADMPLWIEHKKA
jgi:hypothetical protein